MSLAIGFNLDCFLGQSDVAARRDDRKPSTPPIRDQQRNSRIIQPQIQQQRKPEDLDVLAAQVSFFPLKII